MFDGVPATFEDVDGGGATDGLAEVGSDRLGIDTFAVAEDDNALALVGSFIEASHGAVSHHLHLLAGRADVEHADVFAGEAVHLKSGVIAGVDPNDFAAVAALEGVPT